MTSDLDLLEHYARRKSEDAFAELVNRHLDLVHSAALRQVRSPQLAEEIAQSVFADLARSADKLKPDTIITAWLYQVTRRTAVDVIRRESRRQFRERIAVEMTDMNSIASDWTHIEPLLDEAMDALDETDRSAILLRYFENKSLQEVGERLKTSDDAAQKRVSRAVERLREFFAKRGVTVGASGLVVVISTSAVQAAPVGLAVTISTAAALAGTTITTTATAIKTIAMTTLQKTLVTATVAILAGAGIYEARQASRLRGQLRTLESQQADQLQQLQGERDNASAQLDALRDENERSKNNSTELLKLRGEVARLRAGQGMVKPGASTPQPADPADAKNTPPTENELPKDSWADVGFATPQTALQTRGWAVLNGNRERFKESILITDGARKLMEEMLEKMIAAAPEAERKRFSEQILNNNLGLEEGMLFPMMAENKAKGYTGYQIISQQSPSTDEMILEVATGMTSSPAKKETLKFQRVDGNWKVVIDEDFIKSQH